MASSSKPNPKYKRLTTGGKRQKPEDDFDDGSPPGLSRTSSLPIPKNTGLRSRSISPVKRTQGVFGNPAINESTSSLLSNASFLPDTPAHLLPPDVAKEKGTSGSGGRQQQQHRNGSAAFDGVDNDGDSETDLEELAAEGSIFDKLRLLARNNSGILLMLTAQIFASIMSVITRLLETGFETEFHAFQILFARQSISVILCSLYMWWTNVPYFPLGPKEVRWLLVARGVGGFFGVFGLYYSLAYLDISDATVITFLAPSVAGFACYLILKEPFTKTEMTAGLISLAGVVLIARPTALFSSSHPDESGSTGSGGSEPAPAQDGLKLDVHATPAQRITAILVALLGVLGAASAYTTIRWIGKRAHPLISVNYFSAWCTIVSFFALLVVPSIGFKLPQTLLQWTLLAGIGICGFCMQFLLTTALQRERAGIVTHMVYAQMVFALIWDKVIWDKLPAWTSFLGSSLILGSALWVAIRKNREKKPETVTKSEARRSARRVDEERGLVAGKNSDDESSEEEDGSELDDDEARALEIERGIQMQSIAR